MSDGSRKTVVKNADMTEEMQQDAIEVAGQAVEKFNVEKDIAAHIKKEVCGQLSNEYILYSLIKNIIPPGIVLLDETTEAMLHTKLKISSIFTSDKSRFYYSSRDRSCLSLFADQDSLSA